MSDLTMVVGQKANGQLTFSEGPPTDGAVASDNPFVTVSLAADLVSWEADAAGAPTDGSMATVTVSYTGTSLPPDTGPVVVPPITISVSQAPIAETGNFNPGSATIS